MTDRKAMVDRGIRIKVWDLPLRLFHWLLVIAIAVAFLSSEEESPLNEWHILSGWVAATLIAFRLIWGFIGGEHSRFVDFLRFRGAAHHLRGLAHGKIEPALGHNPVGSVAVIMLLVLVGLTVWTGASAADSGEDLHEALAWMLLAMVGVHVVAVVLTSLLSRDNLLRAMVDGTKLRARHPAAKDARPPAPIALLIGVLTIFGAAYAIIMRFDPHAFTLRPTELSEQHGSPGQPTEERPAAIEED